MSKASILVVVDSSLRHFATHLSSHIPVRFNPCCSGFVVKTFMMMRLASAARCFNPCCSGFVVKTFDDRDQKIERGWLQSLL